MKCTLYTFQLNCMFKTRSKRRRYHRLKHVPTVSVAVFGQLKYDPSNQRSLLFPNPDLRDGHFQVGQTQNSLRHASDSLVVAVTFFVDPNAVDTASPTGTPPLPTTSSMTPPPTGDKAQQQTSHVHTTGSVHITDRSNREVYVLCSRLSQMFRDHAHL